MWILQYKFWQTICSNISGKLYIYAHHWKRVMWHDNIYLWQTNCAQPWNPVRWLFKYISSKPYTCTPWNWVMWLFTIYFLQNINACTPWRWVMWLFTISFWQTMYAHPFNRVMWSFKYFSVKPYMHTSRTGLLEVLEHICQTTCMHTPETRWCDMHTIYICKNLYMHTLKPGHETFYNIFLANHIHAHPWNLVMWIFTIYFWQTIHAL